MAKASVQQVTISQASGKVTPRVSLKFTKPNGHTIEVKTVLASPPSIDMIEMCSALAYYLSTGKKPAGWH